VTRRIVCAVAAVAVLALSLLALNPHPAAAAPVPLAANLCPVDEWQNPANWDKCLDQLKAYGGQKLDCLKAPEPQLPTAGLPGWVSSRPAEDNVEGIKGPFTLYGTAGYGLSMYGTGCTGVVTHPQDTFDTAMADLAFTGAATLIAAANSARTVAYNPAEHWGALDSLVESVNTTLYDYVFSVYGALAVLALGVMLMVTAWSGDLPKGARAAGWALIVLIGVTVVSSWPVWTVHLADDVASGGLATMHKVLGPPPEHIDPGKCLSVNACTDHRTVATRASDNITEAVLYRSWLRAELGDADSPVAKKYGPALHAAQAYEWSNVQDFRKDPRQQPVEAAHRQARWVTLAEQIKVEDPEAYAHLQGLRGSDRLGAGILAAVCAVIYTAFDLTASVIIIFCFMFIRLAVMMLPFVGTFGVLIQSSGTLRWMVNKAIACIFNIVIFGGVAGAYLWIVTFVTKLDALGGFMQVLVIFAAMVGCFWIGRPVRRAVRMVIPRKPDPTDPPKPTTTAAVVPAGSPT
jgi:hypothetical protein